MAQLSDDCFAFNGPLLPVAEAEKMIGARVAAVSGQEMAPLREALGRVLTADLIAPFNLPPFDNSAVDGYAVRGEDIDSAREQRLTIIDRVAAGHAAAHAVKSGEAVRIFTGAPMPGGADTVFMQEDCRIDGAHVIVPPGLSRGANRRLAGEDIRAGAVALPAGRRLSAQDIALAAALGLTAIDVRRRVRVALFSTGDEIAEPGSPLGGAALYDSNRYLLAAAVARFGAEITDLGILRDEPKALARAIAAAAIDHDLVLTSGGVSTGEADYVRSAVENVGRIVFWRVAIKPGRPVAMGVIPGGETGEAAAFVGLPGNPVSSFVCFELFARPAIRRMMGREDNATRQTLARLDLPLIMRMSGRRFSRL